MSPRRSSPLTMEHVLLALLDQKPRHGYELFQELHDLKGISKIWNIKQAMLYAILDKMEEKGYLSSKVVPGETYPARKYFSVTAAGKNTVQAWMKTPVRRARDFRQEFLAKLIVCRRYGKPALAELIKKQEEACRSWYSELQGDVPPPDEEHLDEWFVHSFRLHRLEGITKWLKVCHAEVDRLPDA